MSSRPAALDSTAVRYPVEDDVAETLLHQHIRTLLRRLVQGWLADQGRRALVGSDQFVYWLEGRADRSLGPDLFVLPGEDPDREIDSWRVWAESGPPTFALEVVSVDKAKDYEEGPPKYGELGVRELVIYDPLRGTQPRSDRIRWQVHRWGPAGFVRVEAHDDDRVFSEELQCWLVEEGPAESPRVRLFGGPNADWRVPTPEEAERERADALQREVERLRAALGDDVWPATSRRSWASSLHTDRTNHDGPESLPRPARSRKA